MNENPAPEGTSSLTPGRPAPLGIRWDWVAVAFLLTAILAVALYHACFPEPRRRLAGAMVQWVGFLESGPGTNSLTLSGRLRVTDAAGRWQPWFGTVVTFHLRPPDHLRLEWERPEGTSVWIRCGPTLEVHAPQKRFGLRGRPDLSLGGESAPGQETVALPEFRSPIPPGKVWMAALTLQVRSLPEQTSSNHGLWAVAVRPQPRVVRAGTLPDGEVRFWVREQDGLPARVEFWNRAGTRLLSLECDQWRLERSPRPDLWQPQWADGHHIEQVPLTLLTRYWTRWWKAQPLIQDAALPAAASPSERASGNNRGSVWTKHIPLLQVSGTTAERARQLAVQGGLALQDAALALTYAATVEKSLEHGRWLGPELHAAPGSSPNARTLAINAIATAMAESTGLRPYELIQAHQIAARISGWAWAAREFPPSNLQTPLLGYAASEKARFAEEIRPILVVHRPAHGNAWAGVTHGGLWGCVVGMNKRQLTVVALDQPRTDEIPAPPAFVLAADLLETTDNLDTALELLRQTTWMHRSVWLLAEGRTGRAVCVAVGPEDVAVEPLPPPGPESHTWAFLTGPPPIGTRSWTAETMALPKSPSPEAMALETIRATLPDPARAWIVGLVPSNGVCWLQPSGSVHQGPGSDPSSWNLLTLLGGHDKP